MPIKFNYKHSENVYGMHGWRYEPDRVLLLTYTEDNSTGVYYIDIHGALNWTSIYGAPVFATKGHYLDIGYNSNYTSLVRDKDGKEIEAKHDSDEVYFVVEPWTGVALSVGLRLMLNFKLENDYLFENFAGRYFVPYTFVRKEYTMSSAEVKRSLGDLKFALNLRLGIQIVGYLLGIVLLLGGIFLVYWSWKVRKSEGLGEYQTTDDYVPDDDDALKKQPMLNTSNSASNEETKEGNSAFE